MAEMGLSKEDKLKISKWLSERWKGRQECSVCQQTAWIMSDDIVTPNTIVGANIQLGGASYPSVLLICKNCGNTLFFNAVLMGVMAGEEEQEAEEKTSNTAEAGRKSNG